MFSKNKSRLQIGKAVITLTRGGQGVKVKISNCLSRRAADKVYFYLEKEGFLEKDIDAALKEL